MGQGKLQWKKEPEGGYHMEGCERFEKEGGL